MTRTTPIPVWCARCETPALSSDLVKPARPAPWGSPPTPLLPRWYLDDLSTVPLPTELLALRRDTLEGDPLRVVGDLAGRHWPFQSPQLDSRARRSLSRFAKRHPPPENYVVIPAIADLSRLRECIFEVRAQNCIERGLRSGELQSGQPVTVGMLLSLQHFGITSLLEVMCVIEAALDSGFLLSSDTIKDPDPPSLSQNQMDQNIALLRKLLTDVAELHGSRTSLLEFLNVAETTLGVSRDLKASDTPEDSSSDSFSSQPVEPSDVSETGWGEAVVLLGWIFTLSTELHGSRTLADALTSDLGQLMSTLGMASVFDRIPLSDLSKQPPLAARTLETLSEFWGLLSRVEQLTFEYRVVPVEPAGLKEVARKANLTRERIRQIQKYLEGYLESDGRAADLGWCLRAVAAVVCNKAGSVCTESDLTESIAEVFPSKAGAAADDSMIEMARQLSRKQVDYNCSDGICLDRDAVNLVENLKQTARDIADDTGLIDESELQGHLPGDTWRRHWEPLLDRIGLHRLNSNLALRNTGKARVKDALLTIGRPATKEELASVSGINPARVGGHLSITKGIVRADKKRWGLSEWVEDEYEGIAAEIVQRIEEDGGATRFERLLEELPRLFGVTENSVRTYVHTPKFLLKDGYVSLATTSAVPLRPLDEVVHGRTPDGQPYWRFNVEERYFHGYSLTGVPPEIANALGCQPDDRILVPVSDPAGCQPVSVGWPLTSTTGPDVGYLKEPLRQLGARSGQHVLLVIDGPGTVSFRLDEQGGRNLTTMGTEHPTARDRGREILERIKNRPGGL